MTNDEPHAHDPLARLLQPLRATNWRASDHRDALRELLAALAPLGPPRSRLRRALICAGLVAALAAATGAAPLLERLFTIEVVDVRRDANGNVERITVQADGKTMLELEPLQPGREMEQPVIVAVPKVGGGELRIRVLRDHELELLPRFVPTTGSGAPSPSPGERFAVRAVPCPWRVARSAERLVLLTVAGDRRIELLRVPMPHDSLPRYGDERGVVEILDP